MGCIPKVEHCKKMRELVGNNVGLKIQRWWHTIMGGGDLMALFNE